MDATVSKNNKIFTETPKAIYDTMNDAISYPKRISHFSEELPADIRAIYKQNGLELSEGYINGRRIVQFSITPQTSMNDAQLIRKGVVIRTASNNGNLTPMQQDLIKLMEHPDKIDPEIFHKIAEFEYGKGFLNVNYDLILSAIQTIAKGI